MELTGVQKLARVLRVMVIVVFVCNIVALFFMPSMVRFSADQIVKIWKYDRDDGFAMIYGPFLTWWKWYDFFPHETILTLFLWACGICTAIILWQAKRVLDTILKGETFTFGNAANLKRAAVCCFVISGAALIRTVWGLFYYQSVAPLLTYNFLFVPLFLLAGLVCMVMSALFRQAAEMKAENDLTI